MSGNFKVKFSWFTVLLLLAFWGICASFYPSLPEQVPTHWSIQGEADNYSHKAVATLVMPLLPLAIYVLMTLLPQIDPKRQNYSKFGASYEKIRLVIVVVMVGITVLPLLSALGYDIKVDLVVRIFIPLLFIVLGNYMGKIKHNYFLGIKVPWTLASEDVWNKTHRLGGKLMVLGGLIALAGVFTPPVVGFVMVMTGIFAPVVITVIYSYFLYAKTVNR